MFSGGLSKITAACSRETVSRSNYRWKNWLRRGFRHAILQYTLDGAGCFCARGKMTRLGQGDIFVAFTGERSEYFFDPSLAERWQFCWMNVEGLVAGLWKRLVRERGSVLHFPAESKPAREMLDIIRDYESGDVSAPGMSVSLYSHYVTCLHFLSGEETGSGSSAAKLKSIIDRRFARVGGIKALSAEAGLSREHATRSFRGAFGTTPSVYLRRKRVEQAEILLRQSLLSMEQIAARSGFSNTRQMLRAFWSQKGSPPSDYRR